MLALGTVALEVCRAALAAASLVCVRAVCEVARYDGVCTEGDRTLGLPGRRHPKRGTARRCLFEEVEAGRPRRVEPPTQPAQ